MSSPVDRVPVQSYGAVRPDGSRAPGSQREQPATGARLAPAVAERPIRVLVVSDLLLVRAGLERILDASGFALIGHAAAFEEALALATSDPPDVILVDFDLRAEALECIDHLRAAATAARVIVLSDRARSADHPVMVELGATGVVMKSEPPSVLIKAIRKVHAGEVWLDRADTAEVLSRMVRRQHTKDPEAAKIASLTPRECEIVKLVGEGMKNGAIAQTLFRSEATIRNHLTSILDKLGLSDRFELAVFAFRHGLVEYPETQDRRRFGGGGR